MKRFDQDQRGSTVSVDPLGNPERGFSGPLRGLLESESNRQNNGLFGNLLTFKQLRQV